MTPNPPEQSPVHHGGGTLAAGLERLFASWPDAVLLVREDGRIERVNGTAERLFGYSTRQFLSLTVEDLVPEMVRGRHAELREGFLLNPHSRIMADGASFDCERADGTPFPAQVSLEPVTVDGQVMVWAIVKDVSEARSAQELTDNDRDTLIAISQLAAAAVDFQSRRREFGQLIRSIVPTDYTTITTLMEDGETQYVAYLDCEVDPHEHGPKYGESWPIARSTAEEVMRTRKPVMRNFANSVDFKTRYPNAKRLSDNQIRCVINVPLIASQQIFGFVTFRLLGDGDYNEKHLRRAGQIGAAISGSVAQLEMRRRQNEAERRTSLLSAMGRLLASTLDIKEVFEVFADLAGELVPFNALGIMRLEHARKVITLDHMVFRDTEPVPCRGPGAIYPSRGTMMELHRDAQEPVLISLSKGSEITERYPGAAPQGRKNHFLTSILVPMLASPSFNASLLFQSVALDAYTDRDLELAAQIALAAKGPIASAYVHTRELELAQARERNLRAEYEKRRLQEINEAKSQFLGLLSHELKTPLTSITAFADVLHKNRSGDLTERDRLQIDAIRRNGRILESLITDLLDLSVMEGEKVELNLEPVIPGTLVSEAISELDGAMHGKGQSSVMEVSDRDRVVTVDPRRLRQVLVNLIGNACKFSPEGSMITVKSEISGDRWSVSVTDEGPGISDEDAEQVFELFNRGKKTTSQQNVPGTGIGLYIARRIIRAHKGRIWLKGNAGVGATVTFELPTGPELYVKDLAA